MKAIAIVVALILIGTVSSFYLPYNDKTIMPGLITHLVLALTIAQGILFIAAGLFAFQGAFRVKQLGGVVGVGLRIFSVGLIGIGAGFVQFPFMLFFNAWNSFYSTSGLYYLAYIIGGLLMFSGLLVTALRFTNKALLALAGVLLTALIFRIVLFFFPYLLGSMGQSIGDLQTMHTVNTALYIIAALLFIFSYLLKNIFGTSTIGNIFRYLVFGSFFIVLTVLLTIQENITGTNHWYNYYGIYFVIVFLASAIFSYFGYKLKSIKI